MDLSEQKAAARKVAFAARKTAHDLGGDSAGCALLSTYLEGLEPFETISAYMPIKTEISPLPVMQELCKKEKTLCVPVIQEVGLPLLFSVWTSGCEMVEGPFGAKVPAEGQYVDPDVIIAPLVAFDRRGYRLGYGGGFYDRSIEGLLAKKPVVVVGFAYAAQEMPKIPTEPTDQRLDAMVTEQSILRF